MRDGFCTAQCTCLRSMRTVCKHSFGAGALFFHFPVSVVIAFDAQGARVELLNTILTLSFPSKKKGIAAPTEKNQAGQWSCRNRRGSAGSRCPCVQVWFLTGFVLAAGSAPQESEVFSSSILGK